MITFHLNENGCSPFDFCKMKPVLIVFHLISESYLRSLFETLVVFVIFVQVIDSISTEKRIYLTNEFEKF